ncbi:MAG TPA: SRPBCC domain-containing protein [Candidatus Binatia bacterium]|jgi:uncharacterized protein YndB with AHSA1/START domain|nr:SRPBCC domain-containing protein [Candidatus Binatia bacterium]
MATSVISLDQDTIVNQIQVAAPPERVFRALTDANELKRWFSGPDCPAKSWNMDARVGGHYSYTNEKASVVINGVSEFECHGEILECDPPRLLAYTWIANWHDNKSARTVVRWELEKKGSGTSVKVTHSGLASLPVAREDYSGGWPGVVGMLKKYVEG